MHSTAADVRYDVFGRIWARIWSADDSLLPSQNPVAAEVMDLMVMEPVKHIYDLVVFQAIDDIHARSPLS